MRKHNQLTFFERPQKRNSYEEICGLLAGKTNLKPDEFGHALRAWSKANVETKISIVALFSGAGGLDIGFCDAGFELVESVELEEKFVKSMQFNQDQGKYFQGANILCKDIRTYEPKLAEKIDFVIGGPPCQSFSAAGRRAAGVAGTRDDRGSLFEEYVRVIEKLKPKGFLFENVYGLLGAEKGESIKKIVQAFKEIGYNTKYRILDAADYGVPQHRERIIIVGSQEIEFKFPKPTHGVDSHSEIPHFSALEALGEVSAIQEEVITPLNGRFGHLLKEVPPGLNYSFFTEKMGHPEPIFAWRSKFSDFLYKADPVVPIRTLKASGGQYTGPFHWDNRHFTIDELKRLQTFPDDYKIIGNKAIASKQIGNSVPPQFARILAISVLDQFFNVKLPFDLAYLEENEKLSFRNLKRDKSKGYARSAVEALDKRETHIDKVISPATLRFELKDNFKLVEKEDSAVIVEFKPTSDKWTFKLTRDHSKSKEAYRIQINNKRNSPLFAGVTAVLLISNSTDLLDYTLLWKVFELSLAKNNLKADLIQLNGYYQYTNDISYKMTVKGNGLEEKIWKVIEMILVDLKIGQIIDIKMLSLNYELPVTELIACFQQLRKIGFEIRNSGTNKEMDEDHYLIPYKFPTLTPLSVQLKKTLN